MPQGPPPAQTETTAILALSFAIGSFIVCPVIPAIVALVMCPGAMQKIRASNGRLEGEGLVKAARIVAWINIGLAGAVVLLFIVIAIIGAAVSDTTDEFEAGLQLWRALH